MSLDQIGIIVAIVASLGSGLMVLVVQVTKLAKLELKVDTLWDFMMRRAQAELVRGGLGTLNSPVAINEQARKLFAPMKSELMNFYDVNFGLPESEMMLAIERQFGERILKEVCIPGGITNGACLLIASKLAAEGGIYGN
jgi:hypothetical protein